MLREAGTVRLTLGAMIGREESTERAMTIADDGEHWMTRDGYDHL